MLSQQNGYRHSMLNEVEFKLMFNPRFYNSLIEYRNLDELGKPTTRINPCQQYDLIRQTCYVNYTVTPPTG